MDAEGCNVPTPDWCCEEQKSHDYSHFVKLARQTNGTREQTAISTRGHPEHLQCQWLVLDTDSDDLGDQLCVSKMVSSQKKSKCSPTTNSSRTSDGLG